MSRKIKREQAAPTPEPTPEPAPAEPIVEVPIVEVKEKRVRKHQAPPSDKVLEALRAIFQRTGQPATSRQIVDELGIEDKDFGRGAVRNIMAQLTKEGKVISLPAGEGRREKFLYKPA